MGSGNLTFQIEYILDSEDNRLEDFEGTSSDNHSIASKIVATLKRVMSYQQFKFDRKVPTYDDMETASVVITLIRSR